MGSTPSNLAARVSRHWRTKLWLGAALTVVFCAGYFGIQRVHVGGDPRTLPPSFIDDAVPFQPAWAIAYLSMYLMLPLAWLAQTREQLRRYALGFAIMSAIAFACFLVFPVAGPRPGEANGGLLGAIHAIDSPLNSFPSLHVGLATYTACFCVHVVGRRPWLVALLAAWVALIGYSTLATKQHYFVDVPAGVALALLAHAAAGWLLRISPRTAIAPAAGGGAA